METEYIKAIIWLTIMLIVWAFIAVLLAKAHNKK
jgi:hypothetical protein